MIYLTLLDSYYLGGEDNFQHRFNLSGCFQHETGVAVINILDKVPKDELPATHLSLLNSADGSGSSSRQLLTACTSRRICSAPTVFRGRLLTTAPVNRVITKLRKSPGRQPRIQNPTIRLAHPTALSEKLRTYFLSSIRSRTTSATVLMDPTKSTT